MEEGRASELRSDDLSVPPAVAASTRGIWHGSVAYTGGVAHPCSSRQATPSSIDDRQPVMVGILSVGREERGDVGTH